jgi:hypothetical protein
LLEVSIDVSILKNFHIWVGKIGLLVGGCSKEDINHSSNDGWSHVDSSESVIIVWKDNGRSLLFEVGRLPVLVNVFLLEPLSNDKSIHPSEEEEEKGQLGNELEEEVYVSSEMKGVATLKHNSHGHLEHSKDD